MAKPKFLEKIHAQPDHLRELWATLCTIVVVVIVAVIWFHSFSNNVYALLNPSDKPAADQSQFAATPSSLFGFLGDAITNSKASITSFFGHTDSKPAQTNSVNTDTTVAAPDEAHPLPVSGNK